MYIFKLNMKDGFWATPLLIFMYPSVCRYSVIEKHGDVYTALLCIFVLYLQNLGLYTSRRFHLVKGHHVWSLICCPLFIYGKLPKYDYHEAIVKVCLSQSQRCAAALSAFLKETTFAFAFLPFKLNVAGLDYGFEYYQNAVFSIIQYMIVTDLSLTATESFGRFKRRRWHEEVGSERGRTPSGFVFKRSLTALFLNAPIRTTTITILSR